MFTFINKIRFLWAIFAIFLLCTSCGNSGEIKAPTFSPQVPDTSSDILSGIFVNSQSQASNADGRSWDTAFPAITMGIKKALQTGEKIYVAAGIYQERIDLKNAKNIHLIGGYTTKDTHEKPKRDEWTILDGGFLPAKANLVDITDDAKNIKIEGFIFKNVINGQKAIYVSAPLGNNVEGIVIKDCQFLDNGKRITWENKYKSWELTENGAAISLIGAKDVVLSGLTFSKNMVSGEGGAIKGARITNLEIFNSLFVENQAKYGGAIYLNELAGKVVFDKVKFEGNLAFDGRGGAIGFKEMFPTTKVIISGSTFLQNHSFWGGAINLEKSSRLEILDTSFTENVGQFGGAIYFKGTDPKARLVIGAGVNFKKNKIDAPNGGGAICVQFDPFNVDQIKATGQLIFTDKPRDISSNTSKDGKGKFLAVYFHAKVKPLLPANIEDFVKTPFLGIPLIDSPVVYIEHYPK